MGMGNRIPEADNMIEFVTESFTVKTQGGTQVVPAIYCGKGIYVHRPILAPEEQEQAEYYNPSPIWTISAACGRKVEDIFLPHMSFNEFLYTIEEHLCRLDWTGSFDDVAASDEHQKARAFFHAIIFFHKGIDYK